MDLKSPFFNNDPTFGNIIEHWGKGRLEIPMQILARFDDAAKQLIILSTLLQGVYISVFTAGKLTQFWQLAGLALLFFNLLLLIFFAAQAVCTVALKKEAFGTYELFKKMPHITEEELDKAVDAWCQEIDSIADKKHWWLTRAKWTFIIHALLAAIIIPLILMM